MERGKGLGGVRAGAEMWRGEFCCEHPLRVHVRACVDARGFIRADVALLCSAHTYTVQNAQCWRMISCSHTLCMRAASSSAVLRCWGFGLLVPPGVALPPPTDADVGRLLDDLSRVPEGSPQK